MAKRSGNGLGRYILRVAIGSFLLASPAMAFADSPTVLGLGAASCATTVTNSASDSFRIALVAWVGGFVSGVNAASPAARMPARSVSGLNPDLIVNEMVAYCRRHPNDDTLRAALDFYRGLPPAQ